VDADRYLLISADCHAGGSIEQYRGYLDPAYRDDFDAWRQRYSNPFRDLQSDGRTRNWDDERRTRELEDDGVVGEVLFPNTVPPFFPTGAVIARPPPRRSSSGASPAPGPTIAGWPISAPRRPAGARGSRRSS